MKDVCRMLFLEKNWIPLIRELRTNFLMLLGFLILIMLGLKNYLLPQLLEGDGKDGLITWSSVCVRLL